MNTHLTAEERERAAYFAGDTRAAEMFGRIAELEDERDQVAVELEDATTLDEWEKENGPADEYRRFFEECFTRLAGHYPFPNISSDYDKSVIFATLEKGAEIDANGGHD